NARSGPQRFRVRQKISTRNPADRSRPPQDKVDDDASGLFARNRGGYEVTTIADQEARRRFACELDVNFSVIASAGSGKTRLITDDDDLWNEFVQQQTTIGRSLSDENRRLLLRLMQARQLMELARNRDHEFSAIQPKGRCPECDFSKVEAAIETAQAKNIPKA